MIKQFVEDCGDGSNNNPLLGFVNRFTQDKSLWQDQFRDERMPPMQHPMQFGPPPHAIHMEKQIVDDFLTPQEFEKFEIAGPNGPQEFMPPPVHMGPPGFHTEQHYFPPDQFHSEWEKDAVDQRHQDWLTEFRHTAAEPVEKPFGGMEEAWNQHHQPPPPKTWAEEYPKENFEEVYQEISEKKSSWADSYENEQKNSAEWVELARRASAIPDEKLQSSQFMQFVNAMASGELKVDSEGKLVESDTPSWAQQFDTDNWVDQFTNSNWADEFAFNDEEGQLINQYENVWNQVREERSKPYEFQQDNPYRDDTEAFQKGMDLFDQGDLPQAILALEAAVQQEPHNTNAWTKLGLAHAENDKDILAIQALEQALAVDPNNLEALMAQAVSFTNESEQQRALHTLRQWLLRNPKYQHLFPSNEPFEGYIDIRQIEHMLVSAATAFENRIDPDVHSALGLIYNLSYEHPKAIECFRMALREKPDDYQLWNKLGASTANSIEGKERAHEAIDAYFRALQRKPTYTRARANLGISYSAVRNFPEAAKCFLGALEINNTQHLWDNLKKAFMDMNRPDLVSKIDNHNVDEFRSEFDF